ncbi:right-handed parallel beta-helix repeat-containing protein [bacterium]|nr:right-handed parallel beta-helix repeat-containing protein [bacterium]
MSVVIFLLPGVAVSSDFSEVTALRDAHTRIFEVNQTRTYLHPVTGQPTNLVDDSPRRIIAKGTDMNYRDEAGQWQVVDTTVRPSSAPGARLEATRQRAKLYFSDTGSDKMNVRLDLGGRVLETGVQLLAYLEPESGRRAIIARAAAREPSATGNRVLYSNVFPGVDVEYINKNTVLKQNVILRSECVLPDPAQLGMDAASALLVVGTELDYAQFGCNLFAQQAEGELDMSRALVADAAVFSFRAPNDKPRARFAPGRVWGAGGAGDTAVRTRVEWDAGKPYLLDGIPCSKMADMPRPGVIDYTLELHASSGMDEVWDRNNTWWVLTEYQVSEGKTLVIEPGTVVKIGTNTGDDDECIRVMAGGTVRAVGEPLLPVFITSYRDDGYGDDLDGNPGQMSEADPAPGDYPAAFKIEPVYGGNASQFKNCRIRWADTAIVINEVSVGAIRGNVFNNCNTAVQLLDPEQADGFPEAALTNNLIYECGNGIEFVPTGDYAPQCSLGLYFNTFEDLSGAAFVATVDEGYEGYLTIVAENNVIANVAQGFSGPAGRLVLMYPSLDYTGWAQIGANDKYVGVFATSSGSHTHDQTYTGGSPFDTDNPANGRHYLKQDTNIFKDKGSPYSLSNHGLTGTTTKAPIHLDCGAQDSHFEWDKQSVDGDAQDAADLGYHHPRVDYIIGVNTTRVTNEATYYDEGDPLTIKRGVIVAVYRPDFEQNQPYFTRLACFDKLQVTDVPNKLSEGQFVYDRQDAVHVDSSYYLGTGFVRYRWIGSGAPGPYTEADGIWMLGHHNELRAMLLRHLFVGMAFIGCEQRETEHIKGLMFERGDLGIFCNDLPWFYDPIDPLPSNLHTMYNAFVNLSGAALWMNTEEIDPGYFVTFHNETVINCLCGYFIDGNEDSTVWPGLGTSDVNIVVSCPLGGIVGAETEAPETQLFWVGKNGVDFQTPENHDFYWNNGTASKVDQDTTNVTYIEGDSGSVKHRHALLVSKSGAELPEKDLESLYLAQNLGEGEASRLPFRLKGVYDDTDVITVPEHGNNNWPTGDFQVRVYSLEKSADWTASPDYLAYAVISNGEATVYGHSGTITDGDLLVKVTRSGGTKDGDCTGGCWFDLKLRNETAFSICLNAQAVDDIDEDSSLCFWVSEDGSTWYAGETTPTTQASDMVTCNARFAMWYRTSIEPAPPILAMSAFDAIGANAAVDAYPTKYVYNPPNPNLGGWSNGTTSLHLDVDNNTDDDYLPYIVHLLDAGWHYYGWNFFEVQE